MKQILKAASPRWRVQKGALATEAEEQEVIFQTKIFVFTVLVVEARAPSAEGSGV